MQSIKDISKKTLRPDAVEWIGDHAVMRTKIYNNTSNKLHQLLVLKDYGKGTIRNYCGEITLLFKYFNDKPVDAIVQADIELYLHYIKEVHKVGRAKCKSVAMACSFFYKWIKPTPYIVPSNLFPRKQFKLPNIMSQEEVGVLFGSDLTLKEYCIVGLLYGCGMRNSEVGALEIGHIDSAGQRIKIVQSKGSKDRFTLLPQDLLEYLRRYYVSAGKPAKYLFTSIQTKQMMHVRSLQIVVNSAMAKAGFKDKPYTAHTLRHSFATHMLDNGSNLHVIKTLLGHSKIETTMVYLHLQKHTQLGIVSPLDLLKQRDEPSADS